MSDSTEQPEPKVTPSAPSLTPGPPGAHVANGPKATAEGRQGKPGAAGNLDPTVELKRWLEATRLSANLKGQILAELPSSEEQERLYRELQEKGGLSFEQFLDSLDLEVESQP